MADYATCVSSYEARGHPLLSARRICSAVERGLGEAEAELVAGTLLFTEAIERDARERDLMAARIELRKSIAQAWRIQGEAFAKALTKRSNVKERRLREAGIGRWQDLFDDATKSVEVRIKAALQRADTKALTAGFARGLGRARVRLGVAFDLANPRASLWMTEHGAQFVTHITETTRDRMQTLLTESVERGWSVDKTAAAIRREFRGFGDARFHPNTGNVTRAHVVAATETAYAYAEGNMVAGRDLQASGLPMEKRWLPGPSTRDTTCLDNTDLGWIGLGESFPGNVLNPPQHPNCVCDVLIRVAGA